ncbi:MAG TPA: FAD-binding oxidoreductase [Candidatus Saccharibacteria bacterium]|nr:FAD-binding oxidoreductase [Candidatus Saccharibacteria bacterium]
MSKISKYLNEHLLGEVTVDEAIREQFANDSSILKIKPELIVSPRVTNDIRKVARFTWQLAEKGHILPITVRGGGSDQTGASIGKGVIINTLAHLNEIIFISLKDKQRIAHVQPGVTYKSLNDTLRASGLNLPAYPESYLYSTVGSGVANNYSGQLSGSKGSTGDWVTKLEVVLANGDVIETGRINKRELNKKKGLQTLEGELYRKLDGLIEDNEQLITDKIDDKIRDNAGYSGIAKVKQRDGSFDLTPLFIGSQGTLGVISEIVFRTEFFSGENSVVVATFDSVESARDAADKVAKNEPTSLEFIDGTLFDQAHEKGKVFPFYSEDKADNSVAAVLYISFNDFSEGARHRKMKHSLKSLSKLNANVITSDKHSVEELVAVREVTSTVFNTETKGESMPPLIDGASIPSDRVEEFSVSVIELAKKHHIELPLYIRYLDGVVKTRPVLQLSKVGDKQKVFKLISEYAELVTKHGGVFISESGEGRLKANAAIENIDPEVNQLYEQIRSAFDPFGTMNPGVKQKNEMKTLVSALDSTYSRARFSQYSPHS